MEWEPAACAPAHTRCLEDSGNNVGVGKALTQQTGGVGLEDGEDDPGSHPADPESDLTP